MVVAVMKEPKGIRLAPPDKNCSNNSLSSYNSCCNSNNNPNNNSSSGSLAETETEQPIHNLLAALSFERIPVDGNYYHNSNSNSINNHDSIIINDNSEKSKSIPIEQHSALLPPPPAEKVTMNGPVVATYSSSNSSNNNNSLPKRRLFWYRSSNSNSSSNNHNGVDGAAAAAQHNHHTRFQTRIQVVTIDPDSPDDIFYDAQEEGDGDNRDAFDYDHEPIRESILVATTPTTTATTTFAVSSGFETVIRSHQHQNQHEEHLDMASTSSFSTSTSPCPDGGGSSFMSQQTSPGGSVQEQRSGGAAAVLPEKPIRELTPCPPPPEELPLRFLRAGKGDPDIGWKRYRNTLAWRKEHAIDECLRQPHAHFEFIKSHYPHYYHQTGRNGEPVFFELPPQTNLKALKVGGVTLPKLLHHYATITEFGWQVLNRDDLGRSVYIIDLQGIRMTDFVGEVVDFVRKASEFTGQHYPERAGCVMVINVPGWFKLIWNVVKPMVDEVTLQKISILRGKDEIFEALLKRIPMENIPPEYGGQSPYKLGESPEEEYMKALFAHNNAWATYTEKQQVQGGAESEPPCSGTYGTLSNPEPCPFCTWVPARSY